MSSHCTNLCSGSRMECFHHHISLWHLFSVTSLIKTFVYKIFSVSSIFLNCANLAMCTNPRCLFEYKNTMTVTWVFHTQYVWEVHHTEQVDRWQNPKVKYFFQHRIFTKRQISESSECCIVAKNVFGKRVINQYSVLCNCFAYLLRCREIMSDCLRRKLIFCHFFAEEP